MGKQKKPKYQNPLDWFIRQGYESTLALVAANIASQPHDIDAFRLKLTAKLERFRYPQPWHEDNAPTFGEILDKANARDALLETGLLTELWKFLAIKGVLERVAELDAEKLAADGTSIKEHWDRTRQIIRDQVELTRLGRQYGLAITQEQYAKITQRLKEEFRWVIYSALPRFEDELLRFAPQLDKNRVKFRAGQSPIPDGSWPPVMLVTSGQKYGRRTFNSNIRSRQIRQKDRAIQVCIFESLRGKLQTAQSESRGISDIFLCQLTELIYADDNVERLSDGGALRKAATRPK